MDSLQCQPPMNLEYGKVDDNGVMSIAVKDKVGGHGAIIEDLCNWNNIKNTRLYYVVWPIIARLVVKEFLATGNCRVRQLIIVGLIILSSSYCFLLVMAA